jgi:hypothetical protein
MGPTGGLVDTVTAGITANGTTQATATSLTTTQNYVAVVGANGAVKIGAGLMIPGNKIWITNEQYVNALNVFGDLGVVINGEAANASISIPTAIPPYRNTTIFLVKDSNHLSSVP